MPESVIPVVPLDHSVLRSEVFIFDYGVIGI